RTSVKWMAAVSTRRVVIRDSAALRPRLGRADAMRELTWNPTVVAIPPMPRPGMMWRHVVISTRRSWLHGDRRGFRSRGHRIHSSGDYRDPPPQGEHEGLLGYHETRAKGPAIKL